MASYLRKTASALVSAKEYLAQWSSERVFADEPLIVPFPTLATFNHQRNVWQIQIKAWVYLPFQNKSFSDLIPPLNNVKISDVESNNGRKDSPKKNQLFVGAVKTNSSMEIVRKTDEETFLDENLEEELKNSADDPSRLAFFFVSNSAKVSSRAIILGVEYPLDDSDENGFIEGCLELVDHETDLFSSKNPLSMMVDRQIDYEIRLNQSKNIQKFQSTIYFPSTFGISIISDIDDTIKISNVLNKRLLLKHTFYDYFKPIEGMNEIYEKWRQQRCHFHYVSASPYQLFPALRSFLEKFRFPLGTIHLRKFSWSLKFLKTAEAYKSETISNIIEAYPMRQFICVGDSGENDPEIYSRLYRKYPGSIGHILIREISPIDNEQRYNKVFEGIPRGCWTIFREVKQIDENVLRLITRNS